MMHQGLFDTHCHLLDKNYELTPEEIIDDAHRSNVKRLINVCCDLSECEKIINLSSCTKEKGVYASIGIHPNYADNHNLDNDIFERLQFFAKNDNVVAVGECGLDYFRKTDRKMQAIQRELFIMHIKLANFLNKPLIIHCREAFDDCYKLLSKYLLKRDAAVSPPGVMHCFTGSLEDAQRFIKLGFFISFAGNLTFKNAVNLQNVCKEISLKNIVIETDAPYLAPEPHRGKTNYPSYVALTAKKLAVLKVVDYQDLIKIIETNAVNLFRI